MPNALFEDLNGYEKGVLARALLKGLIKQGGIDDAACLEKPELRIPIEKYQMKLLSLFVDDVKASRQRIIEELCQLR